MKKIILILINIILSSNVYSQDTSIVKFFPLKIGNVWIYQGNGYGVNGGICKIIVKTKVKIINSININAHKYFYFSDTTRLISGGGPSCITCGAIFSDTLRIDSINGDIYKYSNPGCNYLNHEIMEDSLKAHLQDTVKSGCNSISHYICSDTALHSFFGVMRQYRSFDLNGGEVGFERSFVKNLGIGSYSCCVMNAYYIATLVGCVLDGVVYGDTSFITRIRRISSDIPKTFSLYHNYPNPFNPTTKIKFNIASNVKSETSNVKLVVYDILGKEVATLVNESLSLGTYEVEFDGNNYASGVYYYTLKTNEFNETKKMILIK